MNKKVFMMCVEGIKNLNKTIKELERKLILHIQKWWRMMEMVHKYDKSLIVSKTVAWTHATDENKLEVDKNE